MHTHFSRYLFVLFSTLFLAPLASGRMIESPDDNTLWIEDGTDIEFGPTSAENQWQTKLQISAFPEGGFLIHPGDEENGASRYVGTEPEYPHLVWKISDVAPPLEGYRQFMMASEGKPLFQMVTGIEGGIFVVPLHTETPKTLLQIIIYNTEFKFDYLKLVRVPEYNILLSSPAFEGKKALELGDELTFRVTLPSSATDVSLEFYSSHGMQLLTINDDQDLQLHSNDPKKLVWTGSLKMASCEGGDVDGQNYGPGTFIVKAIISGDSLISPVWTANSSEFNLGGPGK